MCIAIHLETTGLNPKKDEIIAVAMVASDPENFNPIDAKILYRNDIKIGNLEDSYRYHKLDSDFLKKKGLSEEDFVIEMINFILKYSEDERLPKLMGYNIANFTLPFVQELLTKYDLDVDFSSNLLDAYPLVVGLWGDLPLKEVLREFKPDEAEVLPNNKNVMKKCLTFLNIFRITRKLKWQKKAK
jgi:DNA polymerase III epsilon subunit-like protein